MAFHVRSRDNLSDDDSGDGDRWLSWDGRAWTADPDTDAVLRRPGFAFPLTPTGPVQVGYGPGESELLAAALHVIPASVASGQVPDYPLLPVLPPGVIA
ncbi:hypothetical protein [Nocardia sp. NPDC004711]